MRRASSGRPRDRGGHHLGVPGQASSLGLVGQPGQRVGGGLVAVQGLGPGRHDDGLDLRRLVGHGDGLVDVDRDAAHEVDHPRQGEPGQAQGPVDAQGEQVGQRVLRGGAVEQPGALAQGLLARTRDVDDEPRGHEQLGGGRPPPTPATMLSAPRSASLRTWMSSVCCSAKAVGVGVGCGDPGVSVGRIVTISHPTSAIPRTARNAHIQRERTRRPPGRRGGGRRGERVGVAGLGVGAGSAVGRRGRKSRWRRRGGGRWRPVRRRRSGLRMAACRNGRSAVAGADRRAFEAGRFGSGRSGRPRA